MSLAAVAWITFIGMTSRVPALRNQRFAQKLTRPDTRYQAESFYLTAPCALLVLMAYAVNDEPQPQLPVAFGFVKVKPDPITLVT